MANFLKDKTLVFGIPDNISKIKIEGYTLFFDKIHFGKAINNKTKKEYVICECKYVWELFEINGKNIDTEHFILIPKKGELICKRTT
jgi:hypothetical protein